ncbi:MAG TPA: hypothetical protein VFU69_14705 [Ktedonobacterales bacterium]|nr:hypothetical protein [Ktedonobacterales bacterium]
MALLSGTPRPPSFPSGRYTHTNPLRREAGLRLLTESLPEPLRWAIIRAWRRPNRFVGPLAAPEPPGAHRQRPSEASLPSKHPEVLSLIALVELEMAQRLVEAPLASLTPVTRNRMLSAQGAYLHVLYAALAAQVGEPAALGEFERLLLGVE